MLYVGLTGGIASGKSVVASQLSAAGLAVLDLDRVAHEVMAPGQPAYAEVVAAFGRGVLAADATIDRRLLGARVFGDRSERDRLNAIVHPVVHVEEARRVAALEAAGAEVVVSEAALLIETGRHLRFDRMVVVHCPPQQQRQRLESRNRLSPEEAEARLAAQMPTDLKLLFAHLQVDTSGSLAETERSSAALAGELAPLARRSRSLAPSRDRLLAGLTSAAGSGDGIAVRFMEDVVRAGALDLGRTARLFGQSGDPWYRPQGSSRHAPSAIALPVVAHMLSRAADSDLIASAMASVGRATGDDASQWADACVLALIAAEWLAEEASSERGSEWAELARRWTGTMPRARETTPILSRLETASTPLVQPSQALRDLCGAFLALTR